MGGLYVRWGKRLLDLGIAVPATALLAPGMLAVAALIKLETPGPVFFVQDRLGRGGRVFRAWKFRTMTHQPRAATVQVRGRDSGVTSLGFWLRRFKIDELPQLLNVLRGDLSVVGPRPALPEQEAELDEVGRRRLLVRPGMTGLAQVHGNTTLTWPERWRWDAEYVDRVSLRLDLWIVARTVAVVLAGEGKFLERHIREVP